MKYLSFVLLLTCFLACKDDDDGTSSNLPDLRCADAQALNDNCTPLGDLADETDFMNKLVGSWEIVASEPSPMDPNSGGCTDVPVDERIRFTFTADGVYSVTEPGRPTETGTYTTSMICGFVPPCDFFITYDGVSGFRPTFDAFCGPDGAYVDARSLDGPYFFYQKR